jgi:hypothetical protein
MEKSSDDTNMATDSYTVLKVTPETLLHEIKAQYLKLVKLFHLDRQQHEGDKKYATKQVFSIVYSFTNLYQSALVFATSMEQHSTKGTKAKNSQEAL